MSDAKRKLLYLLMPELPEAQRPPADDDAEIFMLTEANAAVALEKIFAADSVSVWGRVG